MFKKTLLIVLLMAVFTPWAVGQTTITIGNGTTADSNLPIYTKVSESYSQQLYTSAEITDAGGSAGMITEVAFYNYSGDRTRTIEIYMANTNLNSFTEGSYSTGYYGVAVTSDNLVYSSKSTSLPEGWATITLDGDGFEYTGSNLAVVVHMTGANTSSSWSAYVHSTGSDYMALYGSGTYHNDLSAGTYGYRKQSRNNIKLTITPFEGCPKPSVTASNVGSRTATLNWTYPGTDTYTDFEYICSETAITDFTSETGTPVTGTTKELTGLTPETTYYCYVRTVCDASNDEYSDWSNVCTFTTEVACLVPTGLVCTGYTTTTATLEWSNTGAESYEIYLTTTENDVPGENTTATSTSSSNSKLIENLTAETTYYAYVRGNCGSTDGKSNWSEVCSFMPTAAQDITLFETNTITNNYIPFYGNYADYGTRSQFIIPAEKLENLGIGATIKKLTFYSSTASQSYDEGVTVYLKEVSYTEFSSPYTLEDWSSMTDVWTGNLIVSNNQWTIDFSDTPYTYNGGNLMIGLQVTTWGNAYTTVSWYGENQNKTTALYNNASSSNHDWSSTIRSVSFLPKTTFTYIPGTEPDCYAPKDLQAANITSSSADLSWTKSGHTTTCKIQYRAVGASEWVEKNDVAEPYTSYTLSGLNVNTEYEFQVMGVCDEEDTNWSSSYIFTTDCGAYTIPYSYGFESDADMNCWTVIAAGNETGIYTSSNVGYESNSTFRFNYSTTVDQYLISPELSGVTSTGVKVTFYYKCFNSYYTETFKVGYSTTDNAIASFDNWDEISYNLTNWAEYSYIFPAETKYIAISYPKNDNSSLYIDNITFKTPENTFTTEGNWNVATNWLYGTLPTATDDVVINAACTIPANCIATANNITIGGNGILTIEDGGQLIHNNEGVHAIVKKNIAGYTTSTTNGGWYFISSPIMSSSSYDYGITPNAAGLITDDFGNNISDGATATYDLYEFEEEAELEWKNYRKNNFDLNHIEGYLYANVDDVTLSFEGVIRRSDQIASGGLDNTSGASFAGWNLMGNPFTCKAYSSLPYYVIDGSGSRLNMTAVLATTPIDVCTGVMVNANDGVLKFSRTPQEGANNGNVQMTLSQQVVNRDGSSAGIMTIDNAIVSFNESDQLEKFVFNSSLAKLYIPQYDKDYAIVASEGQGTVPVNFKATENGTYTLNVNVEGVEMSYLHLIDNMTGADVDLLANPSYSFDALTTDYESRFKLVFATGNAADDNFAFYSNGNWIINNDGEATLQVIDVTGRILSSETVAGSVSKAIHAAPGVYMLRLVNGNNVKVQKVVVR